VFGFILAHRLRAFEPLRQEMHQGRVDIVDAISQPQKFWIGRGHVALDIWPLTRRPALVLSEGASAAKFPNATEKLRK
jgi:hypothetical protein